jgi:hypothetical protein
MQICNGRQNAINLSIRGGLLLATAISFAGCVSKESNDAVVNQLAVANTSIDTIKAELQTEKDKVAALEAVKTGLNASIATLQAQLASSTEANSNLTVELAAANAELVSVNASLATANATIASLQGQVVALTTSLAAANGQVATLTSSNDNYLKTAYNANQDKSTYKRTADVNAADVAEAEADLASAEAALDLATASAPNADYVGSTLATYLAQDRASAIKFAAVMDLDIKSNFDQAKLVSDDDYQDLLSDLANTIDIKEADLSATKSSYEANFGGYSKGDELTLYSADGEVIGASGVAIYRNTPDGTASGADVPVVAKLTALFLLDAYGEPADVLVWEGTGNPFLGAPVGTAMFTSDSMVAYFAQQEGTGVYKMSSDTSSSVGELTLDFDTKTGTLQVNGLKNGNNRDYAISAELVFNTVTGTFNGAGTQAYSTSNGFGPSETADALINGNLWGAAEAFTAVIDATDTTELDVSVHIMTALAGTGSVAN